MDIEGKLKFYNSDGSGFYTTLSRELAIASSFAIYFPNLSGTLAITEGSQAFTGKTGYNGLVITPNTGAITTGSWHGTTIDPTHGGTGIANNVLSTLTISGSYPTIFTVTASTNVTFPITGKLATLAGTEIFTNKTFDTAGTGNVFRINGNQITAVTGTGNTAVLSTSPTISGNVGFSAGAGRTVYLKASEISNTYTLTLPSEVGSSGTYLKNTGSGVLAWDTSTSVPGYSGYSGYSGVGIRGVSGYSGIGGGGISGYSGKSGYSGIGISGYSGSGGGGIGGTGIKTQGGTIINPTGAINVIVWYAPYVCTVTNVRGYRIGGTAAIINARKNGTSNHLATALSLSSADTWMDGSTVEPTTATYAIGDKLEIMVISQTGNPTQVSIQVDFNVSGLGGVSGYSGYSGGGGGGLSGYSGIRGISGYSGSGGGGLSGYSGYSGGGGGGISGYSGIRGISGYSGSGGGGLYGWADVRSYGATTDNLTTGFNAAITAGEKFIYIPSGIWTSTGQLLTASGLHIGAAGKDQTIINSTYPGVVFQGYGVNRSNITISDLAVNCNSIAGSMVTYFENAIYDNITIKDCHFYGAKSTLLFIAGSNHKILDNIVDGLTQAAFSCGIWIRNGSYNLVRGNTVKNVANNGIALMGTLSYSIVDGNILYGNHRLDSGPPAYAEGGQLAIYDESGLTYSNIISNNNISDGGAYAAGMEIDGYNSIITGNIVHSNEHSGISYHQAGGSANSTHSIISNNIVYNNGKLGQIRPGIWVWGNPTYFILNGNICYDTRNVGSKTQSYGILVDAGSNYYVVTNNVLTGNATGSLDDNGGINKQVAHNIV